MKFVFSQVLYLHLGEPSLISAVWHMQCCLAVKPPKRVDVVSGFSFEKVTGTGIGLGDTQCPLTERDICFRGTKTPPLLPKQMRIGTIGICQIENNIIWRKEKFVFQQIKIELEIVFYVIFKLTPSL